MARRTAAAPVAESETPTAETRLIPLDQLYLHPLNPRKSPPEAEIEALAASIAAGGLLQNLCGFADGVGPLHGDPTADTSKMIGIVAGGRRLRALKLLAARGEWPGPVPVNVTTDADTAAQWPGIESENQKGLSVPDRIAAYAQMREKGHTMEAIATAFAKPIGDVRRLLALAALPDDVIDALRAEKISLGVAMALTTARSIEDHDAALRSALAGKPEWQIKDMLRKDTISSKDKRALYVGLDAYHDAGGGSTTDLFEEAVILHDAALLNDLATAKAEAETEALRDAEGWLWAEFVPGNTWEVTQKLRHVRAAQIPLPEGDAARLEELSEKDADDTTDEEYKELEALEERANQRAFTDQDRATSGIITEIGHNGTLRVERAYRRPADEPRAAALRWRSITRAAESSMPQNLKDDLRHIRLICIQDALRRDEVLCHDLLALQLTRIMKPWQQPFAMDQTHATPPTKADGMTIPAELAAPVVGGEDAATAWEQWQNASGQTIHAARTNGLARAFCRWDGPFVDAIHARQPINARTLWTPNATNFFARVSAGYLDALWRQLVPDEGSRHAGFAGLSKKEKVRDLDQLFNGHATREAMGLSREDNARIDAWLPEELRFGAPVEEGDA